MTPLDKLTYFIWRKVLINWSLIYVVLKKVSKLFTVIACFVFIKLCTSIEYGCSQWVVQVLQR